MTIAPKPKEYLFAVATAALLAALVFSATGNYLLAVGMAGVGALAVWLARRFDRMTPADKLDFFHLWKIPDLTARGTLWLISAFDGALYAVMSVIAVALFGAAFSGSLDISASLAAAIAFGTAALATPARYWRYRRRYEPVADTGGLPLLRYAGDSPMTFREKCGAALATAGVIIAWHVGLLAYMLWFVI